MFEIDLEHQGNVITNDIEIFRDLIAAYYYGKDKATILEDLDTVDLLIKMIKVRIRKGGAK